MTDEILKKITHNSQNKVFDMHSYGKYQWYKQSMHWYLDWKSHWNAEYGIQEPFLCLHPKPQLEWEFHSGVQLHETLKEAENPKKNAHKKKLLWSETDPSWSCHGLQYKHRLSFHLCQRSHQRLLWFPSHLGLPLWCSPSTPLGCQRKNMKTMRRKKETQTSEVLLHIHQEQSTFSCILSFKTTCM